MGIVTKTGICKTRNDWNRYPTDNDYNTDIAYSPCGMLDTTLINDHVACLLLMVAMRRATEEKITAPTSHCLYREGPQQRVVWRN
jgi:hypothetical protein